MDGATLICQINRAECNAKALGYTPNFKGSKRCTVYEVKEDSFGGDEDQKRIACDIMRRYFGHLQYGEAGGYTVRDGGFEEELPLRCSLWHQVA